MSFYKFGVMTEDSRRFKVDRRRNPYCLFSKIIGQESCMETIADLCYEGLGNSEHRIDANVMLVGPPSCGKTTIVRLTGQMLNVVTAIIDGTQVKRSDTVVNEVLKAYAQKNIYLQPDDEIDGVKVITLPTTLIFIDEIHALPRIAQDGLLKATERDDLMLFSKSYVFNCKNVTWIGATTDWGNLCSAFQTRFRRVDLEAPTFDQVVEMVVRRCHYNTQEARALVKFGGIIPRMTFDFVKSVEGCRDRDGIGLMEAIKKVATREGIDEHGMRKQHLSILRVIADANDEGCLLRTLVQRTGLQSAELLKHWLPLIMGGDKPLLYFDRRYYLTVDGQRELAKR